MGQKIHPEGFRVGYIHDWKSNWFNEREFSSYLLEDLAIRDHIEERLSHAGLSDIEIRKQRGEVTVDIHTARPGIVIGKSGAEVDALRRDLHKLTNKPVRVNIREIKRPELDAKLVARCPVVSEAPTGPVLRNTRRGAYRCIRSVPTSTTASLRRRRPRVASELYAGSTRAK